jgi:hypothetical protein
MTSLLLSLAVGFQSKEAPETALAHTGSPWVVALSDEEDRKGELKTEWHTVTMTLLKGDRVKVDCVTLYRNQSNFPVTAEVSVPVWIKGWAGDYGKNLSVKWADEPVELNQEALEQVMTRFEGTMVRQTGRVHKAMVEFRPKAQRSLKTSMTLPVQVTGLDGVERQVGYLLGSQPNQLSTFQLSIKYGTEQVFRVISQSPKWGWQVGPKGAFVKQEPLKPGKAQFAKFRWYKGGFSPIGSTGGGDGGRS